MGPWYAGGPQKVSSLVRSGACLLAQVQAQNWSGGDLYLQIFDANSIPPTGAVPLYSYLVPDKNLIAAQLPTPPGSESGRKLSDGVAIAWSTSDASLTLATASGPIYANGLAL